MLKSSIRQGLSAVIIAKNEAQRIKEALQSIAWADEIIVVDSGSIDGTVDIAREYTNRIYTRNFDDFSSQKNFAISKCSYNWVFSLDCDEVVSEELKRSITSAIGAQQQYDAFKVKRLNKLFGKVLRYAAGNDFPVRLFRKDKARFIQPIHEFLQVDGKIGVLEGYLQHNTTENIKSEFDKTDSYTELEARWLLERNIRPTFFKNFIYPLLVFLDIYIGKRGFLDGTRGLVYAFVSSRYIFIKYLKARKLAKNPRYLEEIISQRFNKLSSQFPSAIDENDSRLNSLLLALGHLSGKRILEIGCGKGRFINVVSKKGAFCVGIDMSSNFIREATQKNKGNFLIASATNLSFKPAGFDAVFAVEVIEHIADLEKCFSEVKKVLKPDGAFIIVDRNILSINNRRFFIPNIIIKKYHELKNDWMYPRGFPYTEQLFLRYKVNRLLKIYFSKIESHYIISDSEKNSKTALLFNLLPISRHFILWKSSGPKYN
jgi:2-polyprenyl-3-methyl-5-hydroxy-6-metoxy-1,4-benzoquinol methylase